MYTMPPILLHVFATVNYHVQGLIKAYFRVKNTIHRPLS